MIGDPGCLDTRGFTIPFGTKLSTQKKRARYAGLGLRVSGVSLLLVIDFFFLFFSFFSPFRLSPFWYVGFVGAVREDPILHSLPANLPTSEVDGRWGGKCAKCQSKQHTGLGGHVR